MRYLAQVNEMANLQPEEIRNLNSHINMHTLANSTLHNPVTFDLSTRAHAIQYMLTKFVVDSSSHFLFRARTDRHTWKHTHKCTDATDYRTHASATDDVGNSTEPTTQADTVELCYESFGQFWENAQVEKKIMLEANRLYWTCTEINNCNQLHCTYNYTMSQKNCTPKKGRHKFCYFPNTKKYKIYVL